MVGEYHHLWTCTYLYSLGANKRQPTTNMAVVQRKLSGWIVCLGSQPNPEAIGPKAIHYLRLPEVLQWKINMNKHSLQIHGYCLAINGNNQWKINVINGN